jgi:predicted nucleotidyltransferase
MDRDQVLAKIRQHEAELKTAGVLRLSLFGSVARNEATPESDVDLLAEFAPGREYSLLDRIHLENQLSDIIGARVDLTPAPALKEHIRERAAREAIVAFQGRESLLPGYCRSDTRHPTVHRGHEFQRLPRRP